MRALQPQLALAPDTVSDCFIAQLRAFNAFGRSTHAFVDDGIPYFVNEYWTARQRQSHALHEVSYRACFKAELPRFFIERLTSAGDLVYDPFMGRGTTLLEAALMERPVAGNDINPLSRLLIGPRLAPAALADVEERLREINWRAAPGDTESDLTVFFHPETLEEIVALKRWFAGREAAGRIDHVDDWIRMVAIGRLTGHSPGFFSVYTLPPNQAVALEAQKKINAERHQTPPRRDVPALILKKSKRLLRDGGPPASLASGLPKRERGSRDQVKQSGWASLTTAPLLSTGPAWRTPEIRDASVALVITSPPFLDVVDYRQDNWLRCWFAEIDAGAVAIDEHRTVPEWEAFVRRCLEEFCRVVRPGGHIAFEVGEVRGGKVLLERNVVAAAKALPLTLLGVMVNDQAFTKTANCWGVSNNRRGTNTNRIVVLRRN